MDLGVAFKRDAEIGSHPFKHVFVGFDKVQAVRSIFGRKTNITLTGLMVDVLETRGYLHIDDKRCCIVVNSSYLKVADDRYLYLDVVHELVHIRQLKEGKELFDSSYAYVDRPTELEAWHHTVTEARRIGLNEGEMVDYLKVDWVSEEDFRRFLDTLGVGT